MKKALFALVIILSSMSFMSCTHSSISEDEVPSLDQTANSTPVGNKGSNSDDPD